MKKGQTTHKNRIYLSASLNWTIGLNGRIQWSAYMNIGQYCGQIQNQTQFWSIVNQAPFLAHSIVLCVLATFLKELETALSHFTWNTDPLWYFMVDVEKISEKCDCPRWQQIYTVRQMSEFFIYRQHGNTKCLQAYNIVYLKLSPSLIQLNIFHPLSDRPSIVSSLYTETNSYSGKLGEMSMYYYLGWFITLFIFS